MTLLGTHSNNYVLGRGVLLFDPFDDSDALTGEDYLGNTPGFEATVESEELEHKSAESGIDETDDTALISVTRKATIRVDNVSVDNLARFVIGAKSTKSQSSDSITDEAVTVQQGRYYQLGMSAGFPAGAREISSVVVTGTGGTPTYDVTDDYLVDAVLGRLYIVPGGAIADDAALEVDYATAAKTWDEVASATQAELTGALRFIADNPKGTNRDLYAPKCTLRPSGALPFKTENAWQEMSYDVTFEKKDTATAALYIDGRAV